MAISGVIQSYTTGGQGAGNREDLENLIAMISPTETPLFTMLNFVPSTNVKHEWMEDTLKRQVDNLTAAVTIAQANIRVAHAASGIPCTTNYPVLVRIDEEMILAKARTTNFISLLTRGYNSSASAAHVSNSVVEILGQLTLEGADAPAALAMTRSKPYNYTEIFEKKISVSDTQKAMIAAGVVGNEIDYQTTMRFNELKIEIERMLITGTRSAGTTTTFRHMGGLWSFISTNKNNASSAVLSEANIEADLKACFDAGGRPSVIMANSTQIQKIQNIYKDRIRSEVEAMFGGSNIQRIISPFGAGGEVAIILNRWVPQHEYYILDMSQIAMGRLIGLHTEELSKTGSFTSILVTGEYTCEVRQESAHARRYGLSTS